MPKNCVSSISGTRSILPSWLCWYLGRVLLQYFPGTSESCFIKSAAQCWLVLPSGVIVLFARYWNHINMRSALPCIDFRKIGTIELEKKLTTNNWHDPQLQRTRGVQWNQLTLTALPAEVSDFRCPRGWKVHLSCDHLAKFRFVRLARCPLCGAPTH